MARFRLNCTDPKTGQESHLIYDTSIPCLVNEETGFNYVVQKGKKSACLPIYNFGDIVKKVRSPKVLRILLGTKCNYNCEYCSQAYRHPSTDQSKLEDVGVFLSRLDEWIDDTRLEKIEFWGGEPLVYIKYLYELVPALRERLSKCEFVLITNGSLLTDKIADFFIQYDVHVCVSHDSYAQSIRGDDPLDNPVVLSALRKLLSQVDMRDSKAKKNRYALSCVLSSALTDPIRAKEWLEKKIGMDFVLMSDCVISTGDASSHDVSLKESQVDELSQNICNASFLPQKASIYSMLGYETDFWKCLLDSKGAEQLNQRCGQLTDWMLTVDLKGNVYSCQNKVKPTEIKGSVYDFGSIEINDMMSFNNRKPCMSCPFSLMCKAACPLTKGNDYAKTCRSRFAMLRGNFPKTIYDGTGLVLNSLDGDFELPVEELVQTKHGKTRRITHFDFPHPQEEVINKWYAEHLEENGR